MAGDRGLPLPADDPGNAGSTTGAAGKQLTVPGNLWGWISQASQATGVPLTVLASALYQDNGGWSGFDPVYGPSIIYQYAQVIAAQAAKDAEAEFHEYPGEARPTLGYSDMLNAAAKVIDPRSVNSTRNALMGNLGINPATYGGTLNGLPDTYFQQRIAAVHNVDLGDPESGRKYRVNSLAGGSIGGFLVGGTGGAIQARTTIHDAYTMFKALVGRDPTSDSEVARFVGMRPTDAEEAISALDEAKEWRQVGSKIQDARRWVDGIYFRITGKEPTNDEVGNVLAKGLTPATLEGYLRSQPTGMSREVDGKSLQITRGTWTDAFELANKWAQQTRGSDATDGEINFILQNGIPTNDLNIGAFYQQMKDNAVWRVGPGQTVQDWIDARQSLTELWQRNGLPGKPSADFINQAVAGNWDQATSDAAIKALPAPGFPDGTTVGEVNRVRDIAKQWKAGYTSDPVTDTELKHFLGLTSTDIHDYYRALPLDTSRAVGGRSDMNITNPVQTPLTPNQPPVIPKVGSVPVPIVTTPTPTPTPGAAPKPQLPYAGAQQLGG